MDIPGDVSPGEKEALAREFRDLEEIRTREAKSRAVVLEILGDIPDADVAPPKNVLFVCKLNPVTEEGDLKIIFSRFGPVRKCDIIRDYVTGDSLQYAFIEFETEESCNEAYFKMQNVLIDDRRIHVDFCQSVSGFWKRYHFKEAFTRRAGPRPDHRKRDPGGRGNHAYGDPRAREGTHRRNRSRSREKRRRSLSSESHSRHRSRRRRRSRSSSLGSRGSSHSRGRRRRSSYSPYRSSSRSESRRRGRHRDAGRHRRSRS